jgi:SAM-dependent methyltransferase
MSPTETPQPKQRRAYFEGLYRDHSEPWTYSHRAAELLRHEYLAETLRGLRPSFRRILDVGCSQGQLTARLTGLAPQLWAVDLSAAALQRARERCRAAAATAHRGRSTTFGFAQVSSLTLPFPAESFDLILLCDGIHSWQLSAQEQARCLEEANRVLLPGGYALLSDHLKLADFDPLLGRVRESPLRLASVRYLHNRLWYSLERGLRPVRGRRATQALLGSRGVARALSMLSSLAGRRGAKHITIVAQKPPSA